jgi:hypothetical protein
VYFPPYLEIAVVVVVETGIVTVVIVETGTEAAVEEEVDDETMAVAVMNIITMIIDVDLGEG